MTAHTQPWRRLRGLDGFGKRRSVRHQRGGFYGAALVALKNGAIDAHGKAEIVRVNDQTAHAASLTGAPAAAAGTRQPRNAAHKRVRT